jgi:hypothetical protein
LTKRPFELFPRKVEGPANDHSVDPHTALLDQPAGLGSF